MNGELGAADSVARIVLQTDPGSRTDEFGPVLTGRSEPARARSSPGAELGLLIRVTDARGVGLPGSRVQMCVEGEGAGVDRWYVTDAQGECSTPDVPAAAFLLRARLDGFASRDIYSCPPHPPRLQLVLEPEALIVGRVVDPKGAPVADANVLAWNTRIHPLLADLTGPNAEDSSALATARSGLDGRFLLRGLDPRAGYDLCAGARGLASADRIGPVEPGPAEILLVLKPIAGVELLLGDPGSTDLGDPRFWEAPDMTWRWPEGGTWVERDDPRLVLAGVSPEHCRRQRSLRAGFFFLVDDDAVPFGPIEFEARVPGYQPVSEAFFAHSLREELTVHGVPLIAVATTWGSLEVSLILAPTHRGGSVAWPELGRLVLQDSHVPTRRFFHVVQSLDRGATRFAHLPAGDYRLSYVPEHGFARLHEPIDLTIHGEATASAVIDLSDSHDLELEVFGADGERHYGTALVEIASRRVGGHGTGFLLFQRPPFVVQGLSSGTYSLTLFEPVMTQGWIELTTGGDERPRIRLGLP